MHKRTAHRWRLGVLMVTAIVFALGSFWLLQLMRQSEADMAADAHKNDPDFIVEKFSMVRMSQQGKPSYIVTGDKLTHRPVDDASDIDKPVVQSLSEGAPPLVIHAQKARVDHNNSQVQLSGGVVAERAESPAAHGLELKTEALTVFPDDEQIKTDLPVEMHSGQAQITGTGLVVDNVKQELNIMHQVRAVFPPRERDQGRKQK